MDKKDSKKETKEAANQDMKKSPGGSGWSERLSKKNGEKASKKLSEFFASKDFFDLVRKFGSDQ